MYGRMNGDAAMAAAIAKAYPQAGLELAAEIVKVARAVGAHPYDLANMIHVESGLTFEADEMNPSSGAVGLIQFMPNTARMLGTSTAALARMSPITQMQYVQQYLDRVRTGNWVDGTAGARTTPVTLDTPQAVYMAVFFPAAADWNPRKRFPQKYVDANTFEHRGRTISIATPQDYMDGVKRNARLPSSDEGAPPITAPTAPVEAPGLLARAADWLRDVLDSDRGAAATVATWSTQGVPVPVRLVDGHGQAHAPGELAPGTYSVQTHNAGVWAATGGQIHAVAGRHYVVSASGGRLQLISS